MHQNERTIHLCAAACGFKHQTGRVTRKRGENEHRTQSGGGEHGSTRESKHLCRRHAHTGNRGGGRLAPGGQRNTGQLHSGYTKSKTSSFSEPRVWNIIQAVYSSTLRGSVARARVSDLRPKKESESEFGVLTGQRIDHDSGSLLGQWSVGDRWALNGMTDVGFSRTGAECSWAAIDWAVILAL